MLLNPTINALDQTAFVLHRRATYPCCASTYLTRLRSKLTITDSDALLDSTVAHHLWDRTSLHRTSTGLHYTSPACARLYCTRHWATRPHTTPSADSPRLTDYETLPDSNGAHGAIPAHDPTSTTMNHGIKTDVTVYYTSPCSTINAPTKRYVS
jgi:hypothetical protein